MSDRTQQAVPFNSTQPKCPKWRPAVEAGGEGGPRPRVFISYKRNAPTDEKIAEALVAAFGRKHEVFIDKVILPGTDWAVCIETKIRESDFLVPLLSAQSVNSEMVKGEIEKAHFFGKESGRPAILPVRVAYTEPFPYSLSPYLNPLQWACWDGDEDTPRLIRELLAAVAGGELLGGELPPPTPPEEGVVPQPLPAASLHPLELPEGTMDPESVYYVARATDAPAVSAIRQTQQGVTIPIKGPRQMGKSSLLLRVMEEAGRVGKQTVLLDFQLFDHVALASADNFYRQFCAWLSAELGRPNRVEEFWAMGLGNTQQTTYYMTRHLLDGLDAHLVLAMDEVERIFDKPFRDDFFSMLRSWHNKRARERPWKRCDLVLVTSTEPYQLIADLNQSPFNVGVVIELEDFTPAEVRELNARHPRPLPPPDERGLTELLGGHPYLTRRAFYLLGSDSLTLAGLLAEAVDDRGPFGDHLRYHLFRMHDQGELVEGMLDVIEGRGCSESVFRRLRGAGLVRKEGKAVLPRCQLYAEYFAEHLR
ncbi:MAG TPA: AAA-like domain-containing protein [Pyrinomonadaceae bacterium]|nr:AAA-like domain-containing protein [Pyrinomonadaceae bacterium]